MVLYIRTALHQNRLTKQLFRARWNKWAIPRWLPFVILCKNNCKHLCTEGILHIHLCLGSEPRITTTSDLVVNKIHIVWEANPEKQVCVGEQVISSVLWVSAGRKIYKYKTSYHIYESIATLVILKDRGKDKHQPRRAKTTETWIC